MSQTRAAIAAGYSTKRASSTGCVLGKDKAILGRISELTVVITKRREQSLVDITTINREYVLNKIVQTIDAAQEAGKHSDVLKACDQLGKWLRMWDAKDAEIEFDGDLSKLTDDQLQNMAKSLEKLADPAIVAAAKRRLALESGEIIDVTPEPAIPADSAAPGEDAW